MIDAHGPYSFQRRAVSPGQVYGFCFLSFVFIRFSFFFFLFSCFVFLQDYHQLYTPPIQAEIILVFSSFLTRFGIAIKIRKLALFIYKTFLGWHDSVLNRNECKVPFFNSLPFWGGGWDYSTGNSGSECFVHNYRCPKLY